MLQMLLWIFFVFLSPQVFAEGFQLSAKGGMWAFSTKNISARSESDSGFGAYAIQASYAVASKWNACLGFNMLSSNGFTGGRAYGVDAGINYYPLTAATSTLTQTDTVSVALSETWRPYIGFHLRQRTFNFILSTTFLGSGLTAGVDYQIGTNWFLNFEARYDLLLGSDDGEAIQTNILIGAGLEF
jgi:hypothetical protein